MQKKNKNAKSYLNYNNWDRDFEYTVVNNALVVTEQLRNKIDGQVVSGRTITINNYPAVFDVFAKDTNHQNLYDALTRFCENISNNKRIEDKSIIYHLIAKCNYHKWEYKVTGDKLFRAYCKAKKEKEKRMQELDKEIWLKFNDAKDLLTGGVDEYGKDEAAGIKELIDLVSINYTPAIITIFNYFEKKGRYGDAAKIALLGIKYGIKEMKTAASIMYLKGADFKNFTNKLGEPDLENAVKYCLEACNDGDPYAGRVLYRMIQEGYIEDGSKYYMHILTLAAQDNIMSQDKNREMADEIMLKNARSLLQNKRYAQARMMFSKALSQGVTDTYSWLAECYMHEENLIKAAEMADKGIRAGDFRAYYVTALMHEKGVNLKNPTNTLSAPNYASAINLIIVCIKRLFYHKPSLIKLQEYIDKGLVNPYNLSADVLAKLNHYRTYNKIGETY